MDIETVLMRAAFRLAVAGIMIGIAITGLSWAWMVMR